MAIRYISIREFSDFHSVGRSTLEAFIDFGLLVTYEQNEQACIREEDIEPLETMLRLHAELGVNLEGIEAIMHMRRRMKSLKAQVEALENRLRRYERLQAAWPGFPAGNDQR